MKPNPKTFYFLKNLRKALNITQYDLSLMMGVHQSEISYAENIIRMDPKINNDDFYEMRDWLMENEDTHQNLFEEVLKDYSIQKIYFFQLVDLQKKEVQLKKKIQETRENLLAAIRLQQFAQHWMDNYPLDNDELRNVVGIQVSRAIRLRHKCSPETIAQLEFSLQMVRVQIKTIQELMNNEMPFDSAQDDNVNLFKV